MTLLEGALAEHDPLVLDLLQEWSVDPIRSHPRFVALMRKYGLRP